MTVADPSCYGSFSGTPECRKCRYGRSCSYYTESCAGERRESGRKKHLSYDSICWSEDVADESALPGMDEPEDELTLILAPFLRYLLNLDRYTLELLKLIMAPAPGEAPARSIREIAELRQCSRQAVHRKILRVIFEHPELRQLFSLVLKRMPLRSRKRRKTQLAPA